MKLQCFVALCIFGLVQSASIRQREIPVHVIYDDSRSETTHVRRQLPQDELQVAEEMKLPEKCDPENVSLQPEEENRENENNLAEAPTDMVAEESQRQTENVKEEIVMNAIRNLDEKIQLSPAEQKESLKHLPDMEKISAQIAALQQEAEAIKQSGDIKGPSADQPQSSVLFVIEQAQEIANVGLKYLRERYVDAQKYAHDHSIEEGWNNLQKNVEDLFEAQRENITIINLKQDNQNQNQNQNQNENNIIQNIVNGFQNITNTFIQNLQQQRPNGTQSEEQQGGFQGFITYFTGGFQQIMNNINNLQNGGANGTQSDTGSTQRPGLVSNFVTSLNQFFGNQIGQQQGGIQNNQSDTGTEGSSQQQGPQGFFQGAINQFNQVVSGIIPANRPTPAPGAQGDTGAESSNNNNNQNNPNNPLQAFQNIGNQVISNFNQFNPFASSTKPPGASGDEGASTTERPNIVQVIQNLNPFRPQQQQQGQQSDQQTTPSNPIVAGIQNAGSQIQQAFGNQSFPNPVESFQNAISGGQNGSNPIQTIQNAFGGGQNGSNPLQSVQNAISGAQSGGNPIQTIQNAITGGNNSGAGSSGSSSGQEASRLMEMEEVATSEPSSIVELEESSQKNLVHLLDVRMGEGESITQQTSETMEAVE